MGSLLEDSELNEEQRDILKYMLLSADKTLSLLNDFQSKFSAPSDEKIPDTAIAEVASPSWKEQAVHDDEFTVLIAEDDPVSRLFLRTLLQREKWNVHEARDGMEALELFKKHSYQLILMDVSMPGMDGIEAARIIRQSDKAIPIFAITAHGEGELKDDFETAGLNDVLRKPIHDDVLLSKIRNIINHL